METLTHSEVEVMEKEMKLFVRETEMRGILLVEMEKLMSKVSVVVAPALEEVHQLKEQLPMEVAAHTMEGVEVRLMVREVL